MIIHFFCGIMCYRRVPLPSFLINYFGQKRIGKPIFLAENGSIKGKKMPKQASNWLNRPRNGGEFAKTDCQIIILAKTDRLSKYFRRPKRRQWDSTVYVFVFLHDPVILVMMSIELT